MDSLGKNSVKLTTPQNQKPCITRKFISPMREQNRQLQIRPFSSHLRPSGSSNKVGMSPHEKRLHNIFSSGSMEPLVMSESYLKHAAFCEKGCLTACKHPAENHVVDDVQMIEMDAAVKPTKSIEDVMRDVVVYVEVRAENDRSDCIKTVIEEMGAKVNERLNKNTTHVVFRDGLQSTYDKAKKLSIPVVSVSWLEACKQQMQLVDPKDFAVLNAHRYDYPELYPKLKRFRGLKSLGENARRRNSESSPVTPKAASVTSTRKAVLASTEKKIKSIVQEVQPNPRRSLFSDKDETSSSVIKKPVAAVILDQAPGAMKNHRRVTMFGVSSYQPAEENHVEVPNTPVSANAPGETKNGRKRLGTPLLNTVLIKRAMQTPQNKPQDQPLVVLNNEPTKNRRRTLFTPNKVIESRVNKSRITEKNDLFMDTSSCGGLIETTPTHGPSRNNSSDALNASFAGMFNASPATPEFNGSTVSASPPTPPFKGPILSATATSFVTPAPTSYRRKTIYDEYANTFNSMRTPQLRRSINEVSKEILSQRIHNINRITEAKTSRNKRAADSVFVVPPPDSFEEFMNEYSTPKNGSHLDQTPISQKETVTTSDVVKKKRKLFTPPHLMPTPPGIRILGMNSRASLNDNDCFNVNDVQVPMKEQSEIKQEPDIEFTVHKSSKIEAKLVRQVSDDAILERPTPAKRPRLKAEKNLPMTSVRPRRRATMHLLN